MTEQMLCTSERKILRIYGPIQDKNAGVLDGIAKYILYKDLNIVEDIKIRIVGWAGRFIRMEDERSKKGGFQGNVIVKDCGKTKNKMEGRRPEGHITDPRNTRMKETSKRQRRIEASSEGDQGPEGTVAP